MMRIGGVRMGLIVVAGVALAATGARGDDGGLDGERWARRSIDLIREQAAAPGAAEGRANLMALQMAAAFNPLLLRDPYAAEVAALAEGYLPRAGADAEMVRAIAAGYRRPAAERRWSAEDALDEPEEHATPDSIAHRILLLSADRRAAREPALLAEMEAVAGKSGAWDRLAVAYLNLAVEAEGTGDRARGDRLGDRLLAILRDHPELLDPGRKEGAAPNAVELAEFFAGPGRRERWGALAATRPEPVRLDLALGEVGHLARRGDFDAARAVIDRRVCPSRPDLAARLEAATRGEVILPPPDPKAGGFLPPEERKFYNLLPPEERKFRELLECFPDGFAARGDVEVAGRMLTAIGRDEVGVPGRLWSFQWVRLAGLAAEAGHAAGARYGYEHAVAAGIDDRFTPAEAAEAAGLVREAIALGRLDLAGEMLARMSMEGPAVGALLLARADRERGDVARAAARLDAVTRRAIERAAPAPAGAGGGAADPHLDRGGRALTEIAAEWQRLGRGDEAERALLAATKFHEPGGVGLEVHHDIVKAAVAMGRVDLLDRLYERADAEARVLLCTAASLWVAWPESRQ